MKTLVFTAQGQYARFRCPYTTTSALTYLCIHPIAVKGMIGAIMGVDYRDLYDYTKEMKIAIEVLKPILTDTQSFNLIAQKSNNGAQNFQSRIQFLRDVKYRIYVQDSKVESISKVLASGNYGFTPYLGCSEHIAKLTYLGLYPATKVEGSRVHSLAPKKLVNIDACKEINLYSDRLPIGNREGREYSEYLDIAFATNDSLSLQSTELVEVGEKYVYFL